MFKCYIQEQLLIEILLCNEFLQGYNAVLCFKNKSITLNDDILTLVEEEKSIYKASEEKLLENVCGVVIENEEVINYKKFYLKANENFKHIKNSSVNFIIKVVPKKSNFKSYSVPHKYFERAKQEIKRLSDEEIIEKSNSNIISPAFFIPKKNTTELRLVIDYK